LEPVQAAQVAERTLKVIQLVRLKSSKMTTGARTAPGLQSLATAMSELKGGRRGQPPKAAVVLPEEAPDDCI